MKFGGKSSLKYTVLSLVTLLIVASGNGIIGTGLAQIPPNPKKPSPETEEIVPPVEKVEPQPQEAPLETQPTVTPDKWRYVRLVRTLDNQRSTPQTLLFSSDSQYLISGGTFSDPNLRVWLVQTGKKLSQIKAQRSSVFSLAMTPKGNLLVSGGEDGGINMWDWPSGKYLGIWLEHQGEVLDLSVSPDGQILVSASLDGIRVWTLNPRRPLYRMTGLGHPTYTLAIRPDGQILASGGLQGEVKFWNLQKGTLVSQFFPHKETITGLIFTSDGKRLITSSEDKTIKIWDINQGKLLYTLAGHSARIRAIALNPDNTTLASASNDGIRFWNIDTGELLNRIDKPYDWVESIAFSPDGRFLASGGYDFKINIWESFPAPPLPHPSRLDQLK